MQPEHEQQWIPDPTQPTINDVLEERGERYGKFEVHAAISQELKAVMYATPNWNGLTHPQREALEMIAHKIARVLNGDPTYVDSWTDIAGYAQLVVRILEGDGV